MQFKRLASSMAGIAFPLLILIVLVSLFTATAMNEPEAAEGRVPAAKPAAAARPIAKSGYDKPAVVSSNRISYDRSILNALGDMYLTLDHIDMWIDEYPDSALRYVRYMPRAMQRSVAGIARYIRSSNGRIDMRTVWREAAALVHYSDKYGVPMALVTAVAHTESTFDPGAVSPKGARGVMQVMWSIHNDLLASNGINHEDSSDPEKGVAAGCLLLSRYIKAYGSVNDALDRYLGAFSMSYRKKINVRMANLHSGVITRPDKVSK